MGKRIVLFLMCLLVVIGHLSAQVTKMSGIVLSKDDGLPVVGASVLIQGTTHGTITDVMVNLCWIILNQLIRK